MADTEKTVATPSAVQAAQAAEAELPRTLMGGTKAMRAAGEAYLPKEQGESSDAYNARCKRSFLFNAFGKTVEDLTGKVFDKEIVLGDDVSESIKTYAEDIDLTGRHLNVFARDALYDGLQSGIGYILVDLPRAPDPAKPPRTKSEAKTAGIRPYLKYVRVEDLIGWQSSVIDGVETLTQVRIRECVTEPDGPWDEKVVVQIRVLTPGAWEVWRETKKDKWELFDGGPSDLPKITLVPFYVNRTGFMVGSPPLAKLAELNVAHWQSSSDQRNIVHVARVPILFWAGKKDTEALVIGAGSAVSSSDPNAKLTYVEHSGAAVAAGRDDLKDLELQMQVMGLQLLVSKPGQTATGEIRDNQKENSPLAMIARSLGDAIEAAFGFMAEYEKEKPDAGGSVEVNTDFGIQPGVAADITSIVSMWNAGLISRETAWAELKRRDFLSESFDVEAEAIAVDAENAAKLDAMLAQDPPQPGTKPGNQ